MGKEDDALSGRPANNRRPFPHFIATCAMLLCALFLQNVGNYKKISFGYQYEMNGDWRFLKTVVWKTTLYIYCMLYCIVYDTIYCVLYIA